MKLISSTCIIAIAVSGLLAAKPAQAQDAPAADQPPQATQESKEGLGDIVVTAQRRSESSREVPISISTVSPETLKQFNLQDLKDIQFATPGMVFSKGINYSLVNIRGIGSFNTNPGLEPAVATYIDGAYLERGFGAVYDIVDSASVQVLRGAQGTLWGRNATGGAILINTADPEQDFSGRVSAELGSNSHQKGEAMLNIPLSDTIAIRGAVRYREDGGYVNNLSTGKKLGWSDALTARGKIAFTPNSSFKAVLQYQYDHGESSIDQNTQILPAVYCASCGSSQYSYPITDPFTTVVNDVNGSNGAKDSSNFFNLKMTYIAGDLTFSSVSTYRRTNNFTAADFDFTEISSFNLSQKSFSHAFTQSLALVSDFQGPVNFSAGVDYLDDTSGATLLLSSVDSFANGIVATRGKVDTSSISGFAEVRVNPTNALTITAGGRYTRDKRFSDTDNVQGRASFSSFTPRFVIAYDTGNTNFYLSYNRGFKAGGYSGLPIPANTYKPEKVDSYEFGVKYLSDSRTLRANLATFLYKYKDIQTIGVDQSNVGNIASANNAGAATGKGFEFDTEYRPNDWIRLFGAVSYLDAKYDEYAGALVQVPILNALGQPIGLGTGREDLSGFPLPRAPKWSGNVGFTLTAPIASGWTGQLTAATRFSSRFLFTDGAGGPLRSDQQKPFSVTQLTGRIYPDSEDYELFFFVNNLTNSVYDNYRFTTAPFGGYRLVAQPRTFGAGISVTF